MAINPILNSISAAIAQQSSPVSVRSQAPIPIDTTVTQKSDTLPSQPVLQNAALQNASTNFAQLGSLLQVAQLGTEQVGNLLGQLQALAQQAADGGESTDLIGLSSEFQDILGQIGQTASGATFGGTSLLSGGFFAASGSNEPVGPPLPDLTPQGIFGGSAPDISTPQGAASALAALATGQATAQGANSSVADLLGQVDFAAASINSVIANAQAATSTLNEGDFANGAVDVLAGLAGKPSAAVQAQTANLSPDLLNLLQE